MHTLSTPSLEQIENHAYDAIRVSHIAAGLPATLLAVPALIIGFAYGTTRSLSYGAILLVSAGAKRLLIAESVQFTLATDTCRASAQATGGQTSLHLLYPIRHTQAIIRKSPQIRPHSSPCRSDIDCQ